MRVPPVHQRHNHCPSLLSPFFPPLELLSRPLDEFDEDILPVFVSDLLPVRVVGTGPSFTFLFVLFCFFSPLGVAEQFQCGKRQATFLRDAVRGGVFCRWLCNPNCVVVKPYLQLRHFVAHKSTQTKAPALASKLRKAKVRVS